MKDRDVKKLIELMDKYGIIFISDWRYSSFFNKIEVKLRVFIFCPYLRRRHSWKNSYGFSPSYLFSMTWKKSSDSAFGAKKTYQLWKRKYQNLSPCMRNYICLIAPKGWLWQSLKFWSYVL